MPHRSFRARVRVATLAACGVLALAQVACRKQPEPSKTPGTGAGDSAPAPAPKHTNRLANTTSPYLLQHAHNPVDWYPWGPEALERAKKEDKPIFLSIGYSTCYWCHVMEREVFENEAIAALMNERFICIKVDREERPDLDEIYMMATQLMTQSGGWPNSVFLTPDLKPFFAGTYFGATDQNGRPGFGTVVTQLGDVWKNQRDKINEVSGRAADAIKNVLGERLASIPKASLDEALVDKAVQQIADSYDPTHGGFGLAPKFPSDFYYSFLLDVHAGRVAAGNKDDATLAMVATTLDAMAAGGIHDHVGGGFHRYSTDGQWKVPHFEKMLYNQAHLAAAYLDASAATGEARYADTARGIFRFVNEVFTGPQGQFYSALDAETDAVEGAYYVWTREEITSVLGDKDAAAFLAAFELADVPIFPGHKHPEGGTLVRKARGEANSPEIDAMLAKLAAARKGRKLPRLDDKAIAAWNGMMIDAYARGAEVLKDDAYRAAAAKAAEFVLTFMRTPNGQLVRSVRLADEKQAMLVAPQEGFLEDYAFVIRGLLALHRVETDSAAKAKWLGAARALEAKADELFWERTNGGYFFATPQPDLIARTKDIGDNATPGGNSVMAHNLIELSLATGDPAYRARAEELLGAFSGAMEQSPRGNVHMVHAVQGLLEAGMDAAPRADRAEANDASEKDSPRAEAVFTTLRAHEFHPLGEDRFTIDRSLRKHGIADVDDTDWKVRLLAVRDLVALGRQGAAGIAKGLTDENLHVRYASATALGILKAADAVPALERALTDDADPLVRSQAAIALGQIESGASVALLKDRQASDPSRDVQHQCELSIDQIGKHMGATEELRAAYATLAPEKFESVRVGDPAPAFTLPDTEATPWSLAEHKGHWVALVWVFADWCPVCHGEFHELIEMREEFEKLGVDVATIETHDRYRARVMVGKEVDPKYWFSKQSFKEEYTRKIWWPHLMDRAGAVGAIYGVDPLAFSVHAEYINRPSTIIIDPEGVVRFVYYGTFWGDRPSIGRTLDMIRSEKFAFSNPRRLRAVAAGEPSAATGAGTPKKNSDIASIAPTGSLSHVGLSASVEPAAAAPGAVVSVTLTLTIDEGWHVNANPASADFLIATAVDVRGVPSPKGKAAPAIEVVDVTYPKPSTLKAPGLGVEAIDVYSGTVRVRARVRVPRDAAPGSTVPLRVLATFQACGGDGVCLMPSDWSAETGVRITEPR